MKKKEMKSEKERERALTVLKLTGSIDEYEEECIGCLRMRVGSQRRQHLATPIHPGQGDLLPGPDSLCKCGSQLLGCFGVMNNS